MAQLTGSSGQPNVELICHSLFLPPSLLAPVNTARLGEALEAVIHATLPSREDVAAQALAGISADAARPPPGDSRITFASDLLNQCVALASGKDPCDGAAILAQLVAQVSQRAPTLLPPVLIAITQILRSIDYHAITRQLGAVLVERLLAPPASAPPQPTAESQSNADATDSAPTTSAQASPISLVLSHLDSTKASQERANASQGTTLAALDLITALFTFDHGKYAAVLAPLLPWSQPTFLRLGLMRRRHRASNKDTKEPNKKPKKSLGLTPQVGMDDASLRGYDPSSITPAQPDIRSRFVQLILAALAAAPLDLPVLAASILIPSSASSLPKSGGKRKRAEPNRPPTTSSDFVVAPRIRPGGYRETLLSWVHDALTNLFQGLPHDPAWLIARVLQDLHDHILAPVDAPRPADRLPRRSLMAALGSQAALDAFLALYGRHDTPTQDEDGLDVRLVRSGAAEARRRRRVAQGGPAFEQGEVVPQPIPGMPPIAEQAHAFLLALTTFRGKGMVFPDDGWYPRRNVRAQGNDRDGEEFDDDEDLDYRSLEQGEVVRAKPPTTAELYNPVLLRLLRSLAPGKLPRHALLAQAILAASPQLVPAYLAKSGPSNLTATPIRPAGPNEGAEGGLSAAWLASASFVGQVLAQPIPVPLDAEGHLRPQPPPWPIVLSALLPAPPLERPVLLRALTAPDRLAQLATLRLILAALERLRRFAILCERAHDAIESDSAWAATWATVRGAAIKALPDVASFMGVLQRADSASSPSVLVTDSAISCLAQYASALNRAHSNNASTPHLTAQCRLDTSRLLRLHTLSPLLNLGSHGPESEAEATFGPVVGLHVLQTIQAAWRADQFQGTPGASFSLLSDSPSGGPNLVVLIRLWLNGKSLRVHQAAEEVLDCVLGQSQLFALNPDEWKAWLYALRPDTNFSPASHQNAASPSNFAHRDSAQIDDVLGLIHECASRASKLFHKYLDSAQGLIPAEELQTGQAPCSPLLVAFVEQFAIRARKGILRDRPLSRVSSFLARLLMGARAAGAVPSLAVSALTSQCAEALNHAELPAPPGAKWLFSSTLPSVQMRLGQLDSINMMKTPQDTENVFKECLNADDLLASLHAQERPLPPARVQQLVSACTQHQVEEPLFELDPTKEPLHASDAGLNIGLLLSQGLFPPMADHVQVPPFTAQMVGHVLKVAGLSDPAKLASLLALLLRSNAAPLAADVGNALIQSGFSGWVSVAQACTPLLRQARPSHAHLCTDPILRGLLSLFTSESLYLARPLLALASAKTVEGAVHMTLASVQKAGGNCTELLPQAMNILLDSLSLTTPSTAEVAHQVLSHADLLLSLPSLQPDATAGALSLALRHTRQPMSNLSYLLTAAETKPLQVWDALLAALLFTRPSHLKDVQTWFLTAPSTARWLELLHAIVLHPRSSLPTGKLRSLVTTTIVPSLSGSDARTPMLAVNVAVSMVQRGWISAAEIAQGCSDLVQQGERRTLLSPALIDLCTALVSIAPTDKVVTDVSQKLMVQVLPVLVRAFAEHETDPEDVPPCLSAVGGLMRAQAEAQLNMPAHLVLPVVEAILRVRFESPHHTVLACTLVQTCAPHWGLTACTRLTALLIGKPRFRTVMRHNDKAPHGSRLPMALILLHLVSFGAAPAELGTALRAVYSGSLDAADRTLFATLQRAGARELSGPVDGLELAEGGSAGEGTTSPIQQLASLDPERLRMTCRLFPRNRRFDMPDPGISHYTTMEPLSRSGSSVQWESVAHDTILGNMYDPLAVLCLFTSALLGQEKPKRHHWVALGSNYAIGLVFCCLSSRATHVRALASTLLGKILGLVCGSSFPERDLLLVGLQALQEHIPLASPNTSLDDPQSIPLAVPLSTTLYAAYVMDACVSPERGDRVGETLARRAMYRARSRLRQRTNPTLDSVASIPILRTFLEGKVDDSSDAQAGGSARVFLLDFLADVLAQGGKTEGTLYTQRLTDHLMALWSQLSTADSAAALSQSVGTSTPPHQGLGLSPALFGDTNRAAAHALVRIWMTLCAQPLRSQDLAAARKKVNLLSFIRLQQAAVHAPAPIWTTLASRTALSLPPFRGSASADNDGNRQVSQTKGEEGINNDRAHLTQLPMRMESLLWEILCDGLTIAPAPETESGIRTALNALQTLLARLKGISAGQYAPPIGIGVFALRVMEVLWALKGAVQGFGVKRMSEQEGSREDEQEQDYPFADLPPVQAIWVQCLALLQQALVRAHQNKDLNLSSDWISRLERLMHMAPRGPGQL